MSGKMNVSKLFNAIIFCGTESISQNGSRGEFPEELLKPPYNSVLGSTGNDVLFQGNSARVAETYFHSS